VGDLPGVGLLAYALAWLDTTLPYLPAMLMLLGAIAWSAHVTLRAIDPQVFVTGTLPAWHFRLYTMLTLAAYFVLGFALLRLLGGRPWQAYFLMGVSMLFFIMYLQFKDLPPFVHYLLGLVLGISLLVRA
jgi:hypothetical protein